MVYPSLRILQIAPASLFCSQLRDLCHCCIAYSAVETYRSLGFLFLVLLVVVRGRRSAKWFVADDVETYFGNGFIMGCCRRGFSPVTNVVGIGFRGPPRPCGRQTRVFRVWGSFKFVRQACVFRAWATL